MLLLSLAVAAAVPVGETHRTIPLASAAVRRKDHKPEMAVTIWYPARHGAHETPQTIGPLSDPFFTLAATARDAKPSTGRHAVVLLSHGFGSSARMMGWLAAPLARAGYVVVSVDHPGNNDADNTDEGSITWWERPRDMRAALDAVAKDPAFAPLIDRHRVAVAGFSMGGMTALALGGAVIEPKQYDLYCTAKPDAALCASPPERPDQPKISRAEGIRRLGLADAEAHAGENTALRGARAVLAIAPNARIFAPQSFTRIQAPTTLIVGTADRFVPAADNAGMVAKSMRAAKLITLPGVKHYSFLATCTDRGRRELDICREAPQQAEAHRAAIDAALDLFKRTLDR